MFSLFKFLEKTTSTNSNTNIITNIITNGAQTDFPVPSVITLGKQVQQFENPILKHLGSLFISDPYAALVITCGGFFGLFLVIRWVLHILSLRRRALKNRLNRLVKESFHFILSWQTFFTAFLLTLAIISASLKAYVDIARIITVILFSFLLYLLYQGVYRFTKVYFRSVSIYPKYRKPTRNRNLTLLLYRLTQGCWVVLFATIFLGLIGVQLGPLLAGLGIASIIIGLALQDSFSHLIGGVSLMLDEVYSVGDSIKLESGIEGTIFEIGLRSTKIRTWDEETVTVPNGVLAKMTITNYTQPIEHKRCRLLFQVDASDFDPDFITDTLNEAVKSVPEVLVRPEIAVTILEVKGNALIIRVVFYVDNFFRRLVISDAVLRASLKLFRKRNIRVIPEERITHVINKTIS